MFFNGLFSTSTRESIRNRRQLASTTFQNLDQKANQTYGWMSGAVRSANDSFRGWF